MALVTQISPDKTLVVNGVRLSFSKTVKVFIHDQADVRRIDAEGNEKVIGCQTVIGRGND